MVRQSCWKIGMPTTNIKHATKNLTINELLYFERSGQTNKLPKLIYLLIIY